MSAGASGQLAFTPHVDEELVRPTEPVAMHESSRWCVSGTESVAPLFRPGSTQVFTISKFTGSAAPADLIESGDFAYDDGTIDWVFGGNLDADSSSKGLPPYAFRGIAANGDYVAFWAGLVPDGTSFTTVPDAEKIGLFRLDLSGMSPVVEAIAIDGEPVEDFSPDAAFDALFPDAVWRIDRYALLGDVHFSQTIVAPRKEPRLGKSSSVALNRDGRVAFRAGVTIPEPVERSRGVIFAEDASADLLFVAIEGEATALIETDLEDVGDVRPFLLGRPVINEDASIAFYAETRFGPEFDTEGTGAFRWDGADLRTIMHSSMDPTQVGLDVDGVFWAPLELDSVACGMEDEFGVGFLDQPDINCEGQVVLRAYCHLDEGTEDERDVETIWLWTDDGSNLGLGSYERIFTAEDEIPGGAGVIQDVWSVSGLPRAFGRPMLNGFGEVACLAGVDTYDPEDGGGKAILLYDRDGVKHTAALTNSASHEYLDSTTNAQQIADLGDLGADLDSYYNDISLNERGQIAFAAWHEDFEGRSVLFYTDAITGGAGLGAAVHTGETYSVPGSTSVFIAGYGAFDTTRLGFGAGSAQDGDSTLTNEGTVVWDVTVPVPDEEGAYGGLPDYLVGVFSTTLPETPACRADLNGDNVCDTSDYAMLLAKFNQTCSGCPEDLNGDGIVNTADLGIFIGLFGRYCSACLAEEGSPESLMVDGGGGSLLEILGFESATDLHAWLEEASEEARLALLDDAVEVIELAAETEAGR